MANTSFWRIFKCVFFLSFSSILVWILFFSLVGLGVLSAKLCSLTLVMLFVPSCVREMHFSCLNFNSRFSDVINTSVSRFSSSSSFSSRHSLVLINSRKSCQPHVNKSITILRDRKTPCFFYLLFCCSESLPLGELVALNHRLMNNNNRREARKKSAHTTTIHKAPIYMLLTNHGNRLNYRRQ